MNQHSSTTKKYYPVLIGAALLAASLFHFPLPVFSAGTEAGQTIRNTATGSYTDDAGQPYTIESNTVEVTVARVAGITNLPIVVQNETNATAPILTGNRVSFEFEITNVGNDASDIFIPGLGQIFTSGLSTVRNATNNEDNLIIQVSPELDAQGNLANGANAGNPFTFGAIPNGTGAIPDARTDNTNASGAVEDVNANGKIKVKVTGTVTATGQGSRIQVRLGNTGTNTDENAPVAGTQNQPDTDGEAGGELDDVRTAGQTTNTGNGPLAGEEKEASALQGTLLGANPLAMAHIGKVRGTPIPGTNNLDDDIIPYSLKLEVRGASESPIFTAGDLEGRALPNVSTAGPGITDNTNLILVSDAIPEFTNLAEVPTSIPPNWTPVYNYQNPDNVLPKNANWTSTPPLTTSTTAATNDELRDVTRIGWVYDARPNPDGDGAIAAGTTNIPTFDFNVVTTDLPAAGGTIANIAQVFGTTDDGAAGVAGTPVFDESGDDDASNFTGENQGPDEDQPSSTGVADPADHGEDTNNDNTGDPNSPGGEDNTYIIGVPGQLVNGPRAAANATGDIFGEGPDNQHDFQNLGVNEAEGNTAVTAKPGETFDPEAITFLNTFTYPNATGAAPLTDVKLQPIKPDFGDIGGTNDHIPDGTTVDILYNGKTASYIYNSTNATDGEFAFIGGANDAIEFPTLAPGSSLDYEVVVNLPAGTDFSTNINRGFPIPIVAFTDDDPGQDGVPDLDDNGTPADPSDDFIIGGNVTVNQIYTGFIKIIKQVRVLQPDGVTPRVENGVNMGFNDDDADKSPRPGDILEYRVIYRNITEPQAGNNSNVILNGVGVNIDENGTADIADGTLDEDANNWALDNDGNTTLDTLHVAGEAEDTNPNSSIDFYIGSTVSGSNDPSLDAANALTSVGTTEPADPDTVTGYRNTISNVPPAGAEAVQANPWDETVDAGDFSFTFQRKVEGFELP